MSDSTDPPSRPRAQGAGSRSRFHHIYYVLAAFDLLTVSLGLYLINRITTIYTDSVALNQVWADRLSDYSDLSQLAAAVNAPGNDVFDSRNVDDESKRLRDALVEFNVQAMAAREDLVNNVEDKKSQLLLGAFEAIDGAMDDMVAEANLIFSYFRNNEPERAGERMAEMDRDYAKVNATLAELGRRVRAIQRAHFDEQMAAAATLRRFEYLIAGLIVLMVTGVTLYGHKLAQRMKQTARQTERAQEELARHRDRLEELVQERTAQLEASHEQLRLAERLASIGTLAAGLGHDMNNVLFPVRCRLDALEAARLDERARAEVSGVRQSVEFLQQLSDGLRLLALWGGDLELLLRLAHPLRGRLFRGPSFARLRLAARPLRGLALRRLQPAQGEGDGGS